MLYYSKFPLIILFAFILLSCGITKTSIVKNSTDEGSNPLLGSWKMQEIHWKTKDTTYSIMNAEPGMFFFTKNSYAIMWTPTRKLRTPFINLSKPTDEECIAGFKSVVFNSGSYTFTDSTVNATAYIAKVPGFEGGQQFYTYKIVNDILHLTMFDETYPNGDKPDWSGKYVTEFVLKKE